MKHFTQSLLTYLKTLCHPIIKNPNTHELRVFLSSLPPAAVNDVGTDLSDYWLKSKRDIDFQFKVAHKLWRQWKETADGRILERIETAGWVDMENRLTHYRNLEWTPESGKDGLVVVLVGVEQATDGGSLEDFYQVSVDTIWKEEMQSRFKSWLKRFLYEKQIDPEDTHLAAMEELLETLRRHGAGDLIRISDFLEWVDFTSVMDSYDALTTFYGNLSFWGLPFLSRMKGDKRKNYVEAAIDFFSYQKYFKENDRQKAIQKIENFHARADKEPALDLRGDFRDEDDLLDCLKTYIEYNDPAARKRLLHFDFAVLKDDILGYTYTRPEPEPGEDEDEEDKIKEPKGFKTLHGPPLEAVLTALWQTLMDFRTQCVRKKKSPIRPSDALKGIYLTGLKFVDFENDNKELAQGLLGGIDAFLGKYIGPIAPESEDGENTIEFSPRLLDLDELPYGQTKTAVPNFQFSILFKSDIRGLSVRRKFKWALPETHSFRILLEMARAIHETEKPSFWLPTFHIRHYPELFFAPDETEIHRVLRAGLSKLTIANLFENLEGIDRNDLSRLGIADLSDAYAKFLGAMVDDGYFSALRDHWIDGGRLYYRYETVIQNLIQHSEFAQFRPIVYKAFLLTEKPKPEEAANFPWAPYVPHAAVTALHPALMGMLNHRETFLAHAWLERATFFLNDDSGVKISENTWLDICDLATVNYPLFGLVSNASGVVLDTRVASFGHIHLVGKPPAQSGPLSSKILQQYDAPEDDDIKDTALFRETRESRVISRILKEYARIYPHAEDGVSLAVLNPANIQAIIAGVDDFLHQKLKKDRAEDARDYPPYHLSLALFMHVAESGEVSRWLNEWRKRWDPAEGASRYEFYQNCRLSVSQKVITRPEDYLILMKNGAANVDIAVLTRFMDTGDPLRNYEKTSPYKPDLDILLKFPILEAPRCEDNRQSYRNRRSRIISNRRFRLAALHSELSVRLANLNIPPEQEHIILSQSDFTPWAKVVDQMHRIASWVLCLDPSVDERLIQKGSADAQSGDKREIIGFASGVGAHGELNYTLSTERASLLDVQNMIQKKVNNLFGPWEQTDAENAARFLVREARKLSGISLVRATGRGEQVRDLIAYALVRRCLPEAGDEGPAPLCDELVVLDAFPHWFENIGGGREMYPDLLRVSASLAEDGLIDVDATLMECKISSDVNRHIQKARSQVENGLHHLVARFMPKADASDPPVSQIVGYSPIFRFDQRFWWAQLQRLIANKAVVDTADLESATAALESLGEGRFRIQWKAAALTIWTESDAHHNSDVFQTVEVWPFQQEGLQIAIPLISCGGDLIRRIGGGNHPLALPLEPPDPPTASSSPAAGSENREASRQSDAPDNGPAIAAASPPAETADQPDEPPASPDEGMETPENFETVAAISIPLPRKPPDRLFLGATEAKRDIFWEFGHPELTNRHLLIFGKSGVGKTYAIQALLLEMGLNGQNSVIVDYTNGFLPDHLEPVVVDTLKPETHLVRQTPLPINPFRKQEQRIAGFPSIPEDSHTVGGRIATVINSVYSNVGEQQRAVLIETIAAGLDEEGSDFRFPALLERLKDEGTVGLSLVNKLSPLVHMKLFGPDGAGNWDRLYGSDAIRTHILQLAGVPREIARIATEFILWDLYDYATNSGRKDVPLPIVLDEIQNLDHRLDAPLGKFLTEGRKFGLSLILATQTLSNLKGDERDRLFQAAHKLFFRPAETEVKEYAKILEQGGNEKAETWIARLNKLNKGECYSLGPALKPGAGALENKIFKIHISPLSDRLNKDGDND